MFCTVALPNGRMRVGRLEGQFENHYRWIIEPTDELLVETMLKLPYNG
jgi:translation initiation factor IF-1